VDVRDSAAWIAAAGCAGLAVTALYNRGRVSERALPTLRLLEPSVSDGGWGMAAAMRQAQAVPRVDRGGGDVVTRGLRPPYAGFGPASPWHRAKSWDRAVGLTNPPGAN